MSFIAGIEQATEKLCWYARTLMLRTCRTTTAHSRRMLKKARLLTRPTLAVISPARPESAKTASLPRDAPYPRQGRNSAAAPRFTVPGNDARTPPAKFFSILLETIMKGPWPVKVGWVNSWLHLASIIHDRFCCNRRSTATTSLRPAGSPIGPSPYCTSTHRGLRAPRAGLATRLSDFATNRHE